MWGSSPTRHHTNECLAGSRAYRRAGLIQQLFHLILPGAGKILRLQVAIDHGAFQAVP